MSPKKLSPTEKAIAALERELAKFVTHAIVARRTLRVLDGYSARLILNEMEQPLRRWEENWKQPVGAAPLMKHRNTVACTNSMFHNAHAAIALHAADIRFAVWGSYPFRN
jgi:hypothetical protein